jgi:predicted glycosyltransferase
MSTVPTSPKVLVAPLDWGLGHATRCIPIIRELLAQNCSVLLAGEGKAKALLQLEFPQLPFVDLPGYRIEYAASGWGLAAKIVAQIPKIISAIKEEQAWLEKVVEEEKIDAVISDNRYGLYNEKIRSVFITHQLRIKAPVKLAEDFLQDLNYQYIHKFDACWVPDFEGEPALAGLLSHPADTPSIPMHYVGVLSRFEPAGESKEGETLLFLLSGPEPQRTLLENQLLAELKDYTKPIVLVRGLPETNDVLELNENITVFPHLPTEELEAKIRSAAFVIARCGYSTVMDLAVLKKKSILIPTPGQTEQEYLARHLMEKNFAFCVEQKKFKLKHALELAGSFHYRFFHTPANCLQTTVASFIKSIQQKQSQSE